MNNLDTDRLTMPDHLADLARRNAERRAATIGRIINVDDALTPHARHFLHTIMTCVETIDDADTDPMTAAAAYLEMMAATNDMQQRIAGSFAAYIEETRVRRDA
jgi:hypothetical protein